MEFKSKSFLAIGGIIFAICFMWGLLYPHIKHCRENVEIINVPSSSLIEDYSSHEFNLSDDYIPCMSFLFYRNSGKDSVGVTNGCLQFSPDFSFWGFLLEENVLVSFGAVQDNDDELFRIKECVIKLYNLCTDEQEYFKTVNTITGGRAYCGQVQFHYYQFNDCLPQFIRKIESEFYSEVQCFEVESSKENLIDTSL